MKRTKIIATIGPSSDTPEMIETLIKSGVNVFRLNLSHGAHEDHLNKIQIIRDTSLNLKTPIAILADLQGPKIRIGEYDGYLKKNEEAILICGNATGNEIPVQYLGLCNDVKIGDKLLLDDGLLELKVTKVEDKRIYCKILVGGKLTSKKGINLPTSSISAEVITPKDREDLNFALENKVDFVALSFVKNAQNIIEIKNIISKSISPETQVIAKIERHEAVSNFEEILEVSDAIMVARGDLGIEISQQKVPLIQKHIIKRCLALGKPSIVATQMLDSMIRNPRSTRAETSDIANAILDGADAVMLSGETASGKYPKEAVRAMNRIALDTESWIIENKIIIGEHVKHNVKNVSEAIAQSAFILSKEIKSKYIIAATSSGSNARFVSKYRPYQLIIAGTDKIETERRLCLSWGVWPLYLEFENNRDLAEKISKMLVDKKHAKNGELITLVSGLKRGKIGGTSMVRIHEIETL